MMHMHHIQLLGVSVKSQRSVKLFWFLPTRNANAEKPKELALSHRLKKMLKTFWTIIVQFKKLFISLDKI